MKVEVAVLGSPSLISLMVSVDIQSLNIRSSSLLGTGMGGGGGGGCQSSGAVAVKVEVAVRPNKRGGGGGGSEGSTADTARKRPERSWVAAIAQRLVHYAIAVSTAVLGRVTRTMSVALLLRNNPKRKKSNLRSPAPPPCS